LLREDSKLDSDLGVDFGYCGFHAGHDIADVVACRANYDSRACAGLLFLRHREEADGQKVFPKLVVLGVAHDTDYLIRRVGFAGFRLHTECLPDRTLAPEDRACEHFINNRDFGRGKGVAVIEVAPAKKIRSHRFEIPWSDTIEPRVLTLA
jgi:hypothetical protein